MHSEAARYRRYTATKVGRISPANRRAFEGFLLLKEGQGLRPSSLYHYANWCQRLDRHVAGKEWTEIEPMEISGFLAGLRLQQLSPSSVMQASTVLKAFLKWVHDTDALTRRMREALKTRDNRALPAGRLVTVKELDLLLEVTPRLRNQALISVLWESGFRLEECLSLNVGSCRFDDRSGAWLDLPRDGYGLKTGPRSVYIVRQAPILRAHVLVHPRRDEPKGPLFLGEGNRTGATRLRKQGVYHILRRACRDAELPPVNAHRFRHSAATRESEAGFTEEDLREKYGWSPGSKMPSRYVHHSLEHREEMARRAVGL